MGVDVVPEFEARHAGGGIFHCLSMTDLSEEFFGQKFDAVICNFSLLGKESVENFFKEASMLLNGGGAFVVQTVHPVSLNRPGNCGDSFV